MSARAGGPQGDGGLGGGSETGEEIGQDIGADIHESIVGSDRAHSPRGRGTTVAWPRSGGFDRRPAGPARRAGEVAPLDIRTVNIRRDPFGTGVELIITYGEGGVATKRLTHAEFLNLLKSGLEHYAEDVGRLEDLGNKALKPAL